MTRIDKRLKELEREVQPKEIRKVVVDWDPDPKPAKPGETIIEWPKEEKENDEED